MARYGHLIKSVVRAANSANPSPQLQKQFTEATLLAFGLERGVYQLGATKVFFRAGKQEWLENVLGQEGDLPADMVTKVHKFMFRRKFDRLRAGLVSIVRLSKAVRQVQALGRIQKATSTLVVVLQVCRSLLRCHVP